MADENLNQSLGFDASQTFSVLAQLEAAFARFGNALAGAGNQIDILNAAAEKLDKAFTKANSVTREVAQIYESTRTPQEAYAARLEKLNALQEIGAINADLYGRAVKQAADKMASATKPAKPDPNIAEGAKVFEATRTTQERYTAQVANLNKLQAAGAITQDTHTRAVKQAGDALEAAGNKTKSFTVSWETMVRVLMTQALVRGLNMVRDAFEYAYDSQLKFVKAISEIKAIEPNRTFAQIADDVRKMSEAFNQPLQTVAEAQYQVLSNQFTSAADQANILTAANQLAKTTEDDLVGATLLLTGSLNAYGESSEMAGLRAAQFFKTIELGRLRATELGTALGRVQSLGHELGVSMEELQASLVSLTIGGLKASEAGTQLRGILTALLKPTPEMSAAFDKLGVSSGEAAIQTWEMQGALEKIKSTTDGSAEALAKMIPNIRGGAGAMRLLSEGAASYKRSMDDLRGIDQSIIAGKTTEVMSTAAETLTAELNKLRNFFTVELGADVVRTLNNIVSLLGGGSGMVGVLRLLTSDAVKGAAAIGTLYIAMNRFGASTVTATTQLQLFATQGIGQTIKNLGTLRNLIGAFALIEVGQVLGNQIGGWISEKIEAPYAALRKQQQDSIDFNKRLTDATIREEERKTDDILKQGRQLLAAQNVFHLQDAVNFKNAMELQVKSVTTSFDQILQKYRKLTNDLAAASEAAAKKAAEAPRRIAEINQGIEDKRFNADMERWKARPDQQFGMAAERARQLGDAAAKMEASAKDDTQQKQADAMWQRAKAYDQMAESAAKQSGNIGLQNQALELSIGLEQKRTRAIAQNGQLQAQLSRDLEARNLSAEGHLDKLTTERDAIIQKFSAWKKQDADGKDILQKPEDAQRRLVELDGMIQKFLQHVRANAKGDFAANLMGDAKAFEEMRREVERMLDSVQLKNIAFAPEAVATLWDELRASADKIRVNIKTKFIVDAESLTGLSIEQVGAEGVMDEFAKIAKEDLAKRATLDRFTRDAAAARGGLTGYTSTVRGKINEPRPDPFKHGLAIPIPADEANAQKGITSLLNLMDKLSKKSKITAKEALDVQEQFSKIDVKKAFPDLSEGDQLGVTNQLANALLSFQKLKDAQEGIKATGTVDPKRLEKVQSIQEQIKRNTEGTKTAIEGQTTAVTAGLPTVASLDRVWQSVLATVNETASASARAASAASSASMASSGSGSGYNYTDELATMIRQEYAATGKYFARGGRGTDTIPAMLSPGEFVSNSATTRKWASQLIAMNAGIQPSFHSKGGNVTNVGDINVSVTGGGSSRQTARSIATELRRELRRGTSTL